MGKDSFWQSCEATETITRTSFVFSSHIDSTLLFTDANIPNGLQRRENIEENFDETVYIFFSCNRCNLHCRESILKCLFWYLYPPNTFESILKTYLNAKITNCIQMSVSMQVPLKGGAWWSDTWSECVSECLDMKVVIVFICFTVYPAFERWLKSASATVVHLCRMSITVSYIVKTH